MKEKLEAVLRPYNPRGSQEVWRQAEKSYKEYIVGLIPPEAKGHAHQYASDLIRRRAIKIATVFLQEENLGLTLENIKERLGYADKSSVYALLQKNTDLVEKLGIKIRPDEEGYGEYVYRRYEAAAQKILDRGDMLSVKSIAEELSLKYPTVWTYWKRHEKLQKKFPVTLFRETPKRLDSKDLIDQAVEELREVARQIRKQEEKVTLATLAQASGQKLFVVESLLAEHPDLAEEVLDE